MTAKARYANSDGILCPADKSSSFLGIILETEHQLGQHLRIHIRQLIRPYLFYHVAGRSRKPAALADLESRLQRNGNCPAGSIFAYIRLVDPGTG